MSDPHTKILQQNNITCEEMKKKYNFYSQTAAKFLKPTKINLFPFFSSHC